MIRRLLHGASAAWANLPLRGKGLVVLAIPMPALLVAALAYLVGEHSSQQVEALVLRAEEVRVASEQISNVLLDANSGMRDYLLAGRVSFLAPYEAAVTILPDQAARLGRLVQNDPGQAERVHRITANIEQELDTLTVLRYSLRSKGTPTGRASVVGNTNLRDSLPNAGLIDVLRKELRGLKEEEYALLTARRTRLEQLHKQTANVIALSLLVGLSGGIIAASLFAAGIVRRITRLQENAALLAQGLPLTPAAAGRDEIGRLGQALERSSVLLIQREQELRGAKDEAEKANRAKNEFLSRMSHELRTPLNAILGFGQLLEMDHLSAEQHEGVEQILRSGRHLLGLIDEVLDIAKIEAGRLALSPEPVRIGEELQEALSLIEPMATARNVLIKSDRQETCHRYVLADRQRLKQIFLNLLSNAVKYNRPGGSVTVSCEDTGNSRLRVKVTDTGPGIPADKMARLFTPFDRLGAEQSEVEGTGLRLSLSKHLAEAMGGTLRIESAPGLGSTFWLELALVESPLERFEQALEPLTAPAAGTPGAAARVVLYIEDNFSNLRLIERLLARRPEIRLIPAMQGRLGVQLAREHRPDLILLDLQLPDISGHDVLRHLREAPETRDTRIIVISADATPGQIDRLLAAGAWRYLTKPLDVKKCLASLDEALAPPQTGSAGRNA